MTTESRPRRVLIIANPSAGQGSDLAAVVATGLRQQGAAVDVIETRQSGEVEELTAADRDHDVIAVAGGDGSINEAVNGLASRDVPTPLALIPAGTANVLAAEIGLGVDADAIVDTILHGRPRPLALGRVNGRYFILMVGIGLDAAVVAAVPAGLKRRLGKAAFLITFFRLWLKGWQRPIHAIIDGAERDAAGLILSNARHYAGRFVLARQADISAPTLEVVLFKSSSRLANLWLGLLMIAGRLDRSRLIEITTARELTVAADSQGALPVQIDGDDWGALPIDCTAGAVTITVLAPQEKIA